MKLKWLLVIVGIAVIVGLYFYAPNVLQGVPSGQARMHLTYGTPPLGAPTDGSLQVSVDGAPVDSDAFFNVPVGTTNSVHYTVYFSSGLIYADFARMFTAPSESGSYNLLLDGLGNVSVVPA